MGWLKNLFKQNQPVVLDIDSRVRRTGVHRCRNCSYWLRQNSILGECRSGRPAVILDKNIQYGVWGLTRKSDFCGEFKLSENGRPC
jgi:hypothetical protein